MRLTLTLGRWTLLEVSFLVFEAEEEEPETVIAAVTHVVGQAEVVPFGFAPLEAPPFGPGYPDDDD